MVAKTGRSLAQWAKLVADSGISDRKARHAWLKSKHALAPRTIMLIVEYAENRQTWDGDPKLYLKNTVRYVAEMFDGTRAHFRPIFEAIAIAVRSLGKDVKICPCKTIVPFYRNHVFAEAKPATNTRLELSFALNKDTPLLGRLIRNKRANENDRLKFQIPLATLADFDSEAKLWLKAAYDADV